MEKKITLASCSEICNLACDIEGDTKFIRAYNRETGERTNGDCLAFVVDFDDNSVFRLALAIQSVLGGDVALSMTHDMGVHSADRQKIVYFSGWSSAEK